MMRLAVLIMTALIVAPAHAQSYPSKTVRWIVPLPPGGSTSRQMRAKSLRAPEAFGAYIRSELARWRKVIAETGAKAD
ncbi:MAG TPA: hypothetical protein VED01_16285 [Burkholderiales bacterium]|nr:hypothetical protein [Burkholderiales bacterium]